jgi:uncharacterized phage protein (TIGR02220 family)
MAWAWEQDCTPTEKFVLLALADHAKDDGTCWPGMRRLAEKTGYTRRTVINAIKSLGEKGLLSSAPRHNAGIQTTNLYLLQAPDVKSLRNGVNLFHPRGESLSSGGESDDTGGVKEVHTEPLKNQTSIKQTKELIPFQKIINHLNDKTGKAFRPTTPKTRQIIQARWREGFRLADFESVIDTKTDQWRGDPKMVEYLRPETLFGTKFEAYLNQGDGDQTANLSPYRQMPNLLD